MVKIYQQKLGLPVENLHAIKMSYSTCRVVTFKLKNQINIDEMLDREEFKLERSYMKENENVITTDLIDCKLMGI